MIKQHVLCTWQQWRESQFVIMNQPSRLERENAVFAEEHNYDKHANNGPSDRQCHFNNKANKNLNARENVPIFHTFYKW